MRLGDWIKSYRDKHGLSMQAMADLCGFSKAYIGVLEKGVNPKTNKPLSPTMQTFKKIADATNCSIDDLTKMLDGDQPITILSPIILPEFDHKNDREIVRDLESIMFVVSSAIYDTEDEAEKVEAFKATLKSAIIQAKRLNRKKYTPIKYSKDDSKRNKRNS